MHQILTRITSIRSSSEILKDVENLDARTRQRFQNTIHSESTALSEAAHHLVSYFDQGETGTRSIAASEEVDDFIIANRNWFPDLEEAAEELRRSIGSLGRRNIDGAALEYLQLYHRIAVDTVEPGDSGGRSFTNQCHYDANSRRLLFLANAPATTRRFQIIRVAAGATYDSLLKTLCQDRRLSSPDARSRAHRAMASYIAAAALLPYHEFLESAEACRYDIELLRQRYEAGYEQICHRLVTLRDPQAEGIPFAFLRADPSGHVSKRFPLLGFPLPRYGHACPLWNVFTAFQTPYRVVRQLSEFQTGRRFLMVSRTVMKRSAAFHEQPVVYAVMLACDALYADRTVYAEGLDIDAGEAAVKVGSTCRLCDRRGCQQRQEPPISVVAG